MNKLIKIYFSKICYNQGQKLTRMAEEKLWLTATAHCGHYVSASVPAVARSTSGSWVASWILPTSYPSQWCKQNCCHLWRLLFIGHTTAFLL